MVVSPAAGVPALVTCARKLLNAVASNNMVQKKIHFIYVLTCLVLGWLNRSKVPIKGCFCLFCQTPTHVHNVWGVRENRLIIYSGFDWYSQDFGKVFYRSLINQACHHYY